MTVTYWAPYSVQNYSGAFGDGSDGALVFDGVATVAGLVPSANVYTATRDLFATSLVVNAGVTLVVPCLRLFCRGLVTGAGTIRSNGNNAAGATGGAAVTNFTLAQSGAGATGGTGVGAAGTTVSGTGGTGGAGGASGGTAGGAGGSVNSTATATVAYRLTGPALLGEFQAGNINRIMNGGAGGGAGGGDATNAGGGGGSGGGAFAIFAYQVTNLTLQAIGGNGAAGVAGNAGGGGGGGGGTILTYTLVAVSGLTTSVAGGALGAGVGTGSPGVAGSAGLVQSFLVG